MNPKNGSPLLPKYFKWHLLRDKPRCGFKLTWTQLISLMIIFSIHLDLRLGLASPRNSTQASSDSELSHSSPTSPSTKTLPEDQIKFVESEQILSNTQLWQSQGLRVDLAYVDAQVTGLNGSPSGLIQGIQIGIGARLDTTWSLAGSLRYGVGREALSGLNFSGLLSSLFHWHGLGLGLGIGAVGIDERPNARQESYLNLSNDIVSSYTLSQAEPPISRCSGFGPLVGISLLYRLPISQVFGLKFGAQIDRARIACQQDTYRLEPDTAQGIVIRQYWDRWSWSWYGALTWR